MKANITSQNLHTLQNENTLLPTMTNKPKNPLGQAFSLLAKAEHHDMTIITTLIR